MIKSLSNIDKDGIRNALHSSKTKLTFSNFKLSKYTTEGIRPPHKFLPETSNLQLDTNLKLLKKPLIQKAVK